MILQVFIQRKVRVLLVLMYKNRGGLPRQRRFRPMNKARRKQISGITGRLDDLKGEVENLRDLEQEYYDEMPENLQGGERGERAEEAIQFLDEAGDQLAQAIDQLNEAEG
jgi:hypothetical protein